MCAGWVINQSWQTLNLSLGGISFTSGPSLEDTCHSFIEEQPEFILICLGSRVISA